MRYPDEVAAVVMEPVNLVLPEPGYLEGVRELAHQHGALLVFDEMVTGFPARERRRPGALRGDARISRVSGRGWRTGCRCRRSSGSASTCERLPNRVGHDLPGETLSLAAGLAVTRVLRGEPVGEHLAEIGSQVREAFRQACGRQGVRADTARAAGRMTFQFADAGALDASRLRTLFVRECARNGVLTTGTLLPSLRTRRARRRAHDARDHGRARARRRSDPLGPGGARRRGRERLRRRRRRLQRRCRRGAGRRDRSDPRAAGAARGERLAAARGRAGRTRSRWSRPGRGAGGARRRAP